MNPSDHPEPDPLSELLSVPRPAKESETFRRAVFAQTTGVIRRRRIVRRVAHTAALAACYVAGVATTSLLTGDRNAERPIVDRSLQPQVPPAPDEAPRLVATGDAEGSSSPSPGENASPEPKSRFEFFRAAGDHQLVNRGNMQAALRLYARALDVASPAELAISADSDNWLLMSLKQSRLQENRHVDEI